MKIADVLVQTYRDVYLGAKWRIGRLRGFDRLYVGGVYAKFRTRDERVAQLNRLRYDAERELIADVLTHLRASDVFYDIGANTGLYSMFAGQVCDTVVAFEPYLPNVRELRANARLNDLDVRVITRPLSNRSGEIGFRLPDGERPGHGMAGISTGGDTRTVPTAPGDQLVDSGQLPPPTVVKIDVEGAESLVIDGLSNALSNERCRFVLCEVHLPDEDPRPSVYDFDTSPGQIREQLIRLGFQVERRSDDDCNLYFKARR